MWLKVRSYFQHSAAACNVWRLWFSTIVFRGTLNVKVSALGIGKEVLALTAITRDLMHSKSLDLSHSLGDIRMDINLAMPDLIVFQET